MTLEEKIANLKAVQGNPIWLHSDNQTSSTRLRLLVAGCIAIVVSFLDIRIGPDPTLFGLQLVGLTDELARWLLAAVVFYLWLHMLMYCLDAWGEFRVRLSGAKAHRHPDFSHDPSLTIYGWWLVLDRDVAALQEVAPKIAKLEEQRKAVLGDGSRLAEHKEMLNAIQQISHYIFELRKPLVDKPLGDALKRFDSAFGLLLAGQNFRWLVFDAGLPLLVGAVGFGLLICSAIEKGKPVVTKAMPATVFLGW